MDFAPLTKENASEVRIKEYRIKTFLLDFFVFCFWMYALHKRFLLLVADLTRHFSDLVQIYIELLCKRNSKAKKKKKYEIKLNNRPKQPQLVVWRKQFQNKHSSQVFHGSKSGQLGAAEMI